MSTSIQNSILYIVYWIFLIYNKLSFSFLSLLFSFKFFFLVPRSRSLLLLLLSLSLSRFLIKLSNNRTSDGPFTGWLATSTEYAYAYAHAPPWYFVYFVLYKIPYK